MFWIISFCWVACAFLYDYMYTSTWSTTVLACQVLILGTVFIVVIFLCVQCISVGPRNVFPGLLVQTLSAAIYLSLPFYVFITWSIVALYLSNTYHWGLLLCFLLLFNYVAFFVTANDAFRRWFLTVSYGGSSGLCSGIVENAPATCDRTVFMLAPHGASIGTSTLLCQFSFKQYGKIVISAINPNMSYVPFSVLLVSFVTEPIPATPEAINTILKSGAPFLIFPGGTREVLDNSIPGNELTIYLGSMTRLCDMLVSNNYSAVPFLILNETDIYTHSKLTVFIFRQLNRCIRMGIPVFFTGSWGIPGLCCTKPLKMVCSAPLSTVVSAEEQHTFEQLSSIKQNKEEVETSLLVSPGQSFRLRYIEHVRLCIKELEQKGSKRFRLITGDKTKLSTIVLKT